MDDKKLSPKWHLIFGGIAVFSLLALYAAWHVLIAEHVVAQAERDGRVAKVMVYYSPTSLSSYLGAFIPESSRCGIRLVVTGRHGKLMEFHPLTDGTQYGSPSAITAWVAWSQDVTQLLVSWNAQDWPSKQFHFPP